MIMDTENKYVAIDSSKVYHIIKKINQIGASYAACGMPFARWEITSDISSGVFVEVMR